MALSEAMRRGRDASLSDLLVNGAALLSLGAAAIHFAVVPEHFTHSMLYGMFFALLAIGQIGWSVALMASPTRPVFAAGALFNAFVILIWVLSRTSGLPLGVDAGVPEPVGIADASATVFEGLVILFCLALTKEGVRMRRVPAGAVSAATLALALAVVPLAGATMLASGVDREAPSNVRERGAGTHAAGHGEGEEATATKTAAASTHVVKMLDNEFAPREVRIEPGDTVKWVNEGQAPHTATSDTKDFDSGNVDAGGTFSFTFEEEGAYVYYCTYHGSAGKNGMWGMVTVAEKGDKAVPAKVGSAPAPTSEGSSAPASVSVSVLDSSFAPQQVDVEAGGTVEWVSKSALPHTVTQDEGAFESGDLSQGSTFSETFDEPGIYKYFCRYHGSPGTGMWGVVQVTEAGETAQQLDLPDNSPKQVSVPSVPGTSKVSMKDNVFAPRSLEIEVGDSVVWANEGAAPHTATADSGTFDSGTVNPGRQYRFKFTKAGTYSYICVIHGSSMSGTIVVTEPGQSTAPKVPPKKSPPQKPPPKDPNAEQVSIGDDFFRPRDLTVSVGTTVQWTNNGDSAHTVTSLDGAFDKTLNPGQSYKFTFKKAGRYQYQCNFHSGMTGAVNVGSGGGNDPPPGDGGGGNEPPARNAEKVTIGDDFFRPGNLSVPVGTTVQWTNNGESAHTVTSSNGTFNKTLNPGQRYSFTFRNAGQYRYECNFHSGMTGVVNVGGSGGGGGNNPPPGGNDPPPGDGGGDNSGPGNPEPEEHDVSIDDNSFDEREMHIEPGDSVIWENDGDNPHTVTSTRGGFDSGRLREDQTYSHTFNKAGTYRYRCKFHSNMTGVIHVERGAEGSFFAPLGSDGWSPRDLLSLMMLSVAGALLLWLRRVAAACGFGHA
ncbi:MAG: cupredoxin domain-containing protein [Actinomycetota bacterium]